MKKLKELDAKTIRIGIAGLILAVVVTILAIDLLGGEDSPSEESGAEVVLSEAELLTQAEDVGHPLYWVGARPGTDGYELSSTSDGKIYVRYLTGGAGAGDPRPDFVTVGTYPVPQASEALRTAKAAGQGTTLTRYEGYEVLDGGSGNNAYLVFDGEPDLQVEVYSPTPGEAGDLASSGAVTPLG